MPKTERGGVSHSPGRRPRVPGLTQRLPLAWVPASSERLVLVPSGPRWLPRPLSPLDIFAFGGRST